MKNHMTFVQISRKHCLVTLFLAAQAQHWWKKFCRQNKTRAEKSIEGYYRPQCTLNVLHSTFIVPSSHYFKRKENSSNLNLTKFTKENGKTQVTLTQPPSATIHPKQVQTCLVPKTKQKCVPKKKKKVTQKWFRLFNCQKKKQKKVNSQKT